ncbi:MAG: flagellar motor switch protein FliG [Gammaproteobacteria bacterium]|uniref:Flagellar motor switch protein FliG n=1 Tax=hydrothermal vent metagenome TaxID=652676 RepID=A0A3B1AQX4_9ZZZZ|nr:flagellar motor switch protein FliG [Gammaproteobacteria bacterium]MCF6261215.1 flagellar motor switch protein FliG [Gammaproteobacteria bacterium]
MAENSEVKGIDRAAIFLMSLGEVAASEVLKHMDPKEVQSVGAAMAQLNNVSRGQVTSVLKDFCATVQEETGLGLGTDDYVRSVLKKALGDDKAEGLIDRILQGGNTKGLETLKWMDSRAVAEIIRLEHPQIIAIVLSYLDPDQSAEVLAVFPDRVRVDVLMRISTLDGIQPAALNELNDIMEKQFTGKNNVKSSSVGGLKSAANILNFIDSSMEGEIMDSVKEIDADLGQSIQDLMFVFDNLNAVDDRDIQTILREISSESLVLALKGADDELKEKILRNMSKRAAEMLRDDLEAKGPVRLSEVEGAQKEILSVARRLADAGDISLGGSGGEEYV